VTKTLNKCFPQNHPKQEHAPPLARAVLAQLPDLLTIKEEQDGHGEQDRRQAAEKSHGPVDSKVVEHACREHWETCSQPRAKERVSGDSGVGVHRVAIDDVV